jgi:mono/diheme cytochrome c family protein
VTRRRLWLLAAPVLTLAWAAVAGAQARPKHLNPYTGDPEAIKEGRALFLKSGCSACHGVNGGGGMGPPLLGYKWKFGGDDETLFKLIRGEIPRQTMPSVFGKVLKQDEIWKIIAYIRTLYRGDPAGIVWGPPPEGAAKAASPDAAPSAPPPGAGEPKQ